MADTKTDYTLATYTPEEASSNINDARLVGVAADGYAQSKTQFADQVAKAKAPAKSDIATAKMISGNRSIASVIKPDNEKFKKSSQALESLGLGFVDDMWERGKAQFNLNDLSYQKSQIGDQFLKSGKITNKQRFQKRSYDRKIQELSERTGNSADLFSTEGAKGIISSIVPTIVESATAVAREPIAAATGTAAGAVPGAIAGGIPGALAGTAGGFFRFGVPAASAVDTWRRTRGELALDLEEHRTPDGKKIPFGTIRNISNGVGIAASAVDLIGLNKILKTTSWFASKVGAQKFAKRTADYAAGKLIPASQLERKWMDVVIELGKSGAIEGATEVAQDIFQNFGKSLGQSFNGTETDFVNALQGFAKDFNARQTAKTFVTGAVVGTVAPVALGTPKAAAKTITQSVRERRRAKLQPAAPSAAQQNLEVAVQQAQPQQPGMPAATTATRALQFSDVLKEVQKLTGSTKLAELQPQTRRELVADQFREAGIDGIWVNPAELADPKYDKVRRLFEGPYANDIERNTVFKADPLIVIQTLEEMPDAADSLFQEKPEILTAQQTVDLKTKMEAQKKEILQRPSRFAVDAEGQPLPAPLAAPAPMTDENIDTTQVEAEIDQQLDFETEFDIKKTREAENIQITPEMTDEQIIETLQDQETAQAYLNRLDREIVDTLAADENIPLFHGTRGPEFEQLDPSRSGGMVFFGESEDIANRYAQGAGGGRFQNDSDIIVRNNFNPNESLQLNSKTGKWEGVWDGENVSFSNDQINAFINDGEVTTESKSARVIESSYNPEKILDITQDQTEFKNLLESIRHSNKSADLILNDSNINAGFWSRSKFASRSPEINAEMIQISQVLKDAGFEGIRFKDDSHVTVALFNPRKSVSIAQLQETRNRIQDLMDILPSETAEVIRAQDILDGSEPVNTTETWFMQQTPLPPDLRNALPQNDVAEIEGLYKQAQTEHRDAIMDGASKEYQKLIDETEKIALTVDEEMIREELANDPELKIVDEFERSKTFAKDITDSLSINKKRGYPAYAMDPDLLTETQRERYLEDPRLIERKAFTKGGISPSEVAQYLGVADGDTLLEILATKPTTEEVVQQRIEMKEAQIAEEARESVPVNEAAIIKSFEALGNFDKRILNMLRNRDWSTFKKITRQIAFTRRTTEQIRAEAEYEIANTRIKDLNLKKYERGAIESRKKAMEALFKGNLQEAYDQTLNALHNVELQRAAALAVARTNRGTNKIARFFTNRVKAQLKQAGPKYVDAINEIMDVLNLSPFAKGESKQGAYQALAQEMIERGQGDVSMPEHLMAEIDPREPWYNMTTAQYDYVVNEMSAILKAARDANKVLADYKKQQVDQTVQITEATVQVLAEQHPDHNPEKLKSVLNKPLKAREQAWEMFDTFIEGSFGNIQAVTTHLDQGKPDGLFTSIFWNTLLGKGEKQGPYGAQAKLEYLAEFQKTFNRALKKYGSLKLKTASKEIINVTQFAGNPKLRNGEMTKAELLGMALHIGNESNMDRLMNYDISKETIWEVMEEHLTTEDMDLIQEAVWNVFDATKERVIALEKLDGREIQLIEPRPFQFKGKTYAGGWMHLEYKSEESGTRGIEEWVKAFSRKDGELNEEQLAAFQITRGMTKQGHLKERTGSDQLPILNFATVAYTMDMVANDLAMRIPIREVAKLLTNRKIKNSIISVVGKAAHQTMINGTFHLTMSDDARRIKHQLQSEALLDRIFTNMEHMEAVNALGGRITSILMQFQSFGALIERMGGANGLKHLSKVMTTMAMPWNYNKIPYFYQLAKEIDPALGDIARSVETYQKGGVSQLMPTDAWGSKPFNMVKWTVQWGVEKIMSIFSITDLNVNGLGALAAYSQYMAGEAPGQDRQALITMSHEERRAAARKYAADLTDFTLTRNTDAHRSEFQKSILGKRITRYFNDVRAQFNANLQSHREYRYALREAAKIAKEGDLTTAAEKFGDAGSQLLTMITLGAAMTAYEALVRSQFSSAAEDEEEEIFKLVADMTSRRFLPLPIVRDILFGAETGRPASVPAFNFMTKVAQAGTGVATAAGNYIEGMDVLDAAASMSKKEQQAVASMLGNIVGGVPINGPWKWVDAATDPDAKNVDPELVVLGLTGLLIQRMKEFVEKFKDDPKMKGVVEAVKKDQAALSTQPEAFTGVTDDFLDALREAENPVVAGDETSGKWNTKNPFSNAFGFYQITPETWKDIVRFAPDSLGLTDDGLWTDETGQQARAGAKFWMDRNAEKLMQRGIAPTPGALYGFWHFGLSGWTKIATAKPETPKEDVVSQAAFRANPWLNNENIKTAQDVKDFVERRMENASKKMANN